MNDDYLTADALRSFREAIIAGHDYEGAMREFARVGRMMVPPPRYAPECRVETAMREHDSMDVEVIHLKIAVSKSDLASLDRAMLADVYAQKAADAIEALILDGKG